MLVIECVSEVCVNNNNSAENRSIGDKWVELSDGKYLLLWLLRRIKMAVM